MIKATFWVFIVLTAVACGTAPTRSNAQPFTVISEQVDPVAGSLTLLIRVSGAATEANVKSAVESAIASRKGEYRHMVVKSYIESMTASDVPFAISRFEDGSVTHRFNTMAETQRIPTH